jgi:hypothetical protein
MLSKLSNSCLWSILFCLLTAANGSFICQVRFRHLLQGAGGVDWSDETPVGSQGVARILGLARSFDGKTANVCDMLAACSDWLIHAPLDAARCSESSAVYAHVSLVGYGYFCVFVKQDGHVC